MDAATAKSGLAGPGDVRSQRIAWLALGAIAAAALLVVVAVAWRAVMAPAAIGVDVAAVLRATAAEVDAHGREMIDHGSRLVAAARSSTGPNREHWIADGEHMVADGLSLQALARRLRSSAAMLGAHPTEAASFNLSLYRGEAAALASEGQAAIDHGRGMVEHARYMLALASASGSGVNAGDVAAMERAANDLVAAGEKTKGVAALLAAFVERMDRGLGVNR